MKSLSRTTVKESKFKKRKRGRGRKVREENRDEGRDAGWDVDQMQTMFEQAGV